MESDFIKEYSFGRIVIGEKTYTNDIILLGKDVHSSWWRDKGHLLQKRDLTKIIDFQPDLLIIGTGNTGNMTVPSNLPQRLNFEIKSYPTEKAVKKYNEKIKIKKKIAGAFHLTC